MFYLYIKTHNKTGLKYLGRTKNDPYRYSGSGSDWIKHVKKYGNDVTTKVIKECKTFEEVKKWGIHYSQLWDVVESKEWANIITEKGSGASSEWATERAKERIAKGDHNFQGDKNPSRIKIKEGTHHFQNSEWQRQRALKQLENGNNAFVGGEIQRKAQRRLVAAGIHPFLLPKTEEWRSNHSKVMRGKVPWNKGLTKETDPRVVTKVPPWNKGKTGVQDYSFRKTRTRKCQISKS